MNIVITNAYVNLASGILNQAMKDIEKFENQTEMKEREMNKPYNKRDYTPLISDKDFKSAKSFLDSEYAKYLTHMVIDWKLLNDHSENVKEITGKRHV